MGCHAHVRRKFFEAKDQSPELSGRLLNQIGQLYRIEKELRQQRAGPALREAIRASQSRPIHQRFRRAVDLLARRRSILPQSLLGKALRYALNQWEPLTVYLGDGRVEIDNNSTENAIRPTKLGAKNWMFIGRGEAGGTTAILTFTPSSRSSSMRALARGDGEAVEPGVGHALDQPGANRSRKMSMPFTTGIRR